MWFYYLSQLPQEVFLFKLRYYGQTSFQPMETKTFADEILRLLVYMETLKGSKVQLNSATGHLMIIQ